MPSPSKYQPPCRELWIYYLKGRVGGDPLREDEDFIGNWEEEQDSFLFFKQPADDRVQTLLDQQPHLRLQERYEMSYEDWQGGAMAPLSAGRLRVVPPWHPEAATPQANHILLDPGVVFGTGTHPTTYDCLAAIQLAFAAEPVADVLDLGTGTGLLALAAARLGARRVLAVDLNRLAVQTALRNVHTNDMAHRVLVAQGNAINFIDLPNDLMVSNIHYDVMRHLVAADGFSRQRQFVLSGLLRSQARDIEYQLRRQPVAILHRWEHEHTWFTYSGRSTRSRGTEAQEGT
ncbi:MAG: 50S ribosomal protein L11 methyltransferase [Desulfobacterales bacterium]|nr:50S ribosomal protein L11 methyltransferase [Desulfobacterales bacterium]